MRARIFGPAVPRRPTVPDPARGPLKIQLRDWLHVIANKKDSYELRYYNIHDNDADEDDE